MTDIRIKRVYEPEDNGDGFRVLVDKLWPRGVRKQDLHYDLWEKDIAPSAPLRQWYHQDKEGHWEEFAKRYTGELKQSPAVRDFLEKIKGHDTVTLLYGSKNAAENHALILQEYLRKELDRSA